MGFFNAITHGIRKAAHAVERVAGKAVKKLGSTARVVGHGISTVGQEAVRAIGRGAQGGKEALENVGGFVKEQIDYVEEYTSGNTDKAFGFLDGITSAPTYILVGAAGLAALFIGSKFA